MQSAPGFFRDEERPSLRWLRGQPQLTGLIRQQPEDFVVVEDLGFSPAGEGEHAYLQIEKRHANTRWVAWQLSEFAGVREVDVGYAGRKDRHAVTTQWFSCHLPGKPDPDWREFSVEGVALKQATRHTSKLRPGDLASNRFELLVRMTTPDVVQKADLEMRLETLIEAGFPNYFGAQRFGRDEQNLEAADRMLRKRERIKGDRGMLISAARSALFNQYLSSRLLDGHPGDDSGPLYGRSRDPQPGENQLDEIHAEWVAGLRRLKAKASTRHLIARPISLSWSWREQGLQLGFDLGPGSYATSLLRELFLVEDASLDEAPAEVMAQ